MAKSKRKFRPRYILIISSIVLVNMVGVSYAYWNDSLEIDTHISTGILETKFTEAKITREGDSIEGEGIVKASSNENKITISTTEGGVSENYKGKLRFKVENTGSIPIVIKKGVEELSQLNTSNRVIKPKESATYELEVDAHFLDKPINLLVEQINK